MRVFVSTRLNCRPDDAWAEVQTSRLLQEVAWPIVTFRPVDEPSFPVRWQTDMQLRCRSLLLGIIPLGTRVLRFDAVDEHTRTIQTREHDPLVRRWDHTIRVQSVPGEPALALYSDEIEIQAGLLTPLVALFAQVFYRHRQRRWRRIAIRLSRQERSPVHS